MNVSPKILRFMSPSLSRTAIDMPSADHSSLKILSPGILKAMPVSGSLSSRYFFAACSAVRLITGSNPPVPNSVLSLITKEYSRGFVSSARAGFSIP